MNPRTVRILAWGSLGATIALAVSGAIISATERFERCRSLGRPPSRAALPG
jgi:hypothetical protein